MEDSRIVALYWERSESAISETAAKYGKYCYSIAHNILSSHEDAQESVNDTYLAAWNAIPPHRPAVLSTFLGKITRRVAINKWRARNSEKRGGGEVVLALEELDGCVPSGFDVSRAAELRELGRMIDRFLATLGETERDIFVCRYWFLAPVKEISEKFAIGESKTKMLLLRTRQKLREYLVKEGYA